MNSIVAVDNDRRLMAPLMANTRANSAMISPKNVTLLENISDRIVGDVATP